MEPLLPTNIIAASSMAVYYVDFTVILEEANWNLSNTSKEPTSDLLSILLSLNKMMTKDFKLEYILNKRWWIGFSEGWFVCSASSFYCEWRTHVRELQVPHSHISQILLFSFKIVSFNKLYFLLLTNQVI